MKTFETLREIIINNEENNIYTVNTRSNGLWYLRFFILGEFYFREGIIRSTTLQIRIAKK